MEPHIIINTQSYPLTLFAQLSLEPNLNWANHAQDFLKKWLSGEQIFSLTTSGSTGKPKSIQITRHQMIASAEATIEALQLQKGTKALLCINTAFIGGTMMLVRAIVGSWQIELIEPTSAVHETLEKKEYDFAALVPLQLSALLNQPEGERLMNKIDKVIIGGAAISESSIASLQPLECLCYHTYGMTETVSHIGLRPLNGDEKSDWFRLIGDNEIRLNKNGCLEIKGTVTHNEWITTHDIVDIDGARFRWMARADLVVNSGGIKIQIEKAEEEINALLPRSFSGTLILWKKPNEILGEELVGISNHQATIDYIQANREALSQQLSKYHLPKTWFICEPFLYTQSGKIDRKASFNQLSL